MDIQTEVQKIHHQFGVSEKANYEIQKLFDKAIKEAVAEALRIHDVVRRSEQLADHQCKFYVNAEWTKLKCECGKEQLPKG
jgi:hypothetical protein